MAERDTESGSRGELFSHLLITNRRRIYGFIYSLLHDHNASDDLFQEVSTILWRKFDNFEEGTDFAAWAMSVARYSSLNWRRKQVRLPLALEDDDLMRLADEAVSVSCNFDERLANLRDCLTKLPERLRRILNDRYVRGDRVREIAGRRGKSVRSIYMFLEKAHGMLMECVERRMRDA